MEVELVQVDGKIPNIARKPWHGSRVEVESKNHGVFACRDAFEMMRKRLVQLAEKRGHNHPLVLAMSQRLDVLIVEYMRGDHGKKNSTALSTNTNTYWLR